MDVIVTVDQRYDRTPDGKIWTSDQYAYQFFSRYLEVFECVKVLSRVQEVAAVPPHYLPVDGDRVTVLPVPYYHGVAQFIKQQSRVQQVIQAALTFKDAIIFRAPSVTANIAIPTLARQQFPYGIEVISDPGSTFSSGGIRHPLRSFFRWRFVRALQQQCAGAAGASYVTRHYLQAHYPCPAYSISASDVEIADEAVVAAPRPAPESDQALKLIFVGSFDQLYKAPDILIQAYHLCLQNGLDLCLTLVGDGHYRPEIEQQVAALNLPNKVHFAGKLSGAANVRAALDQADLFILPSRAEGLPRALIEAMARGLPCIGTTVGGIPELLLPEDMVAPDDSAALAQKITDFATNPARMLAASKRNLEVAGTYHASLLRERHHQFYRHILEQTRHWLSQNHQ